MDTNLVILIFKFLFAHALVDFALQPTSMAVGKNRHRQFDGSPDAVWLVTGNVFLGIIEVVLHWFIDFAKCENWTNIHIDQLLHIICKAIYIVSLKLWF
jgi:hypothetical protein